MRKRFPFTSTVNVPPNDCVMCAVSPLNNLTLVPTGITDASTSRWRILGSELCMDEYTLLCAPLNLPPVAQSTVRALGGHRLLRACERRHRRVPRQNGALDTRREFVNTAEDREFADIFRAGPGRDQCADVVEERANLGLGLSLERLAQQRGRRFGNRTPAALPPDVLDPSISDPQVHGDMIPAQRIVALGGPVGVRQRAKIPWTLVMVEDHLLIQFVQVIEHGKGGR